MLEWIGSPSWPASHDGFFWFVRAIKSHPEAASANVGAVHERVLVRLEQTGRDAPAALRVNLFTEDGAVAFLSTWESVRFPMGVEPFTSAFQASETRAGFLQPPRPRIGQRYPRFLTTAALLQILLPQRVILLPYRLVASEQHFGCDLGTVESWIGWATDSRLLTKTRDYIYRPGGRGAATEYVFALHAIPDQLTELASRVGVRVTPEDVRWTAGVFDGSVRPR